MNERRRTMLAAAVVVALAICALAASSASAVLLRLPDGQVVSYQPLRRAPITFDKTFTNMDYNGGPVMPSNTDYMVLWSPKGLSAYGSSEYYNGIARYFKDLQHDSGGDQNVDSISAQYGDATGAFARYQVTFGGMIVDTDPYPASQCPVSAPTTNCLTDAQLEAELTKVAIAHNIPHDLSHELFLLTPPHVEGCFTDVAPDYGGCSAGASTDPVYCAYHEQTVTAPMIFYADDPYVTGNSGCDDGNHPNGPSDGALEGGLAHEHNESITDPIPNDAWTNGAGTDHGEEIGDQCEGQMGPVLGTAPNGASYNQKINGHDYWYQEMWSNAGHMCLQRLTLPALPHATFTATAGTGDAMTFNATGSGPSIADFSWQFNAVANASTVEKTAPSITETFPAAGAYSIGLAVFQANGTSAGFGGIVTTGQSGFTPGFTDTVSGLSVSFDGLTNISRKPVTNDLWEFGDGTTGSGASPTHVYAKAGTYTVTVVEFSGVGSAYPGAGAAPVYAGTVTVT